MNILLTNDDGIYAPGLWALEKQFSKNHKVAIVAPDRERSAVGHGITLHDPLRASKVSVNGSWGYAVNGKPADCIKIAVLELLDFKPDMVISGINPGANIGASINYSGTVAAAKEAALYGLLSMAVSIQSFDIESYDEAACFTEKLSQDVYKRGLPFGTLLNVNLPDLPLDKIQGISISRQGVKKFSREYYEKRIDPRKKNYHWLGMDMRSYGRDLEIDGDALAQNYISITPIKCDMTDYAIMEDIKSWDIQKKFKC
ncbi:Nucleoside 5'-monophosphate phosphohydrolase [Desulfonema limicola]|uniref:5'-nucleotidase SurE n=1 Tax=Desulfonema limicola TaxID=45656 RepID=A0A975B8X8_9BACT|nr:5'/3'-nucleotidase SurE [Desulfonema limicola]QTA80903.1 Nucleoside 5'-monophosphate phosphohydrolase [Desulfonema limicola]